ncbi:uncharacterized protein LOC124168160 isoform X2 [Ischnura elegans]|uniref:uncharacterized protein LOC124168160 isoform X2 n=1 Tax=Ischnura elegans TaxID=197161 RepID=UPI001ED87F02|nr:uncharacterized protein LOC124168160 isoform X2 [Ischnura elegans]
MPKVQGASNSLVKIKVVKHDIERVERSYGGKSKCESSRKRSLPIKTGDVLERKKSTMRNPIKKVRFNLLHSNPEEPRPSGSRGEEHENATLVAHFNKSLNLDIPGCSKDGRTPGPSAAHAIVRLDSDNDDIISSTAEIGSSPSENETENLVTHPDLEKMKKLEDKIKSLRDITMEQRRTFNQLQNNLENMRYEWNETIDAMESLTILISLNTHRMEQLIEMSAAVMSQYDEVE